MGFWSCISSDITSNDLSDSESEKQAGSAKGELFLTSMPPLNA